MRNEDSSSFSPLWDSLPSSWHHLTSSACVVIGSLLNGRKIPPNLLSNTEPQQPPSGAPRGRPRSNSTTIPSSPTRHSLLHQQPYRKASAVAAVMANSSQSDLVWMIRHDENPYNAVRGHGGFLPSSMTAIRSLLALNHHHHHHHHHQGPDGDESSHHDDEDVVISESETSSQLAEGTVRAWRDLALDEAVELQVALRYWTSRWERPFLSWLEALPFQLLIVDGRRHPYNHQQVGAKVGRLQAVLARRCAAIGELQQRLLEAGWREGVAQWGVLGGGHSWAAVAGFDPTPRRSGRTRTTQLTRNSDAATTAAEGVAIMNDDVDNEDDDEDAARMFAETGGIAALDIDNDGPLRMDGSPQQGERPAGVFRRSSQAQIFVGRQDGDGVYVDDPSFLAEWSVESIRLIRRQLLRAGNYQVELPCADHWTDANGVERRIPTWATVAPSDLPTTSTREYAPSSIDTGRTCNVVTISNLPAMVKEIGDLLDVMQRLIVLQRSRRLDQMRPPTWIRRNWYIVAAVVPPSLWLSVRLLRGGSLRSAIGHVCGWIGSFFTERVWTPLTAIISEIWQGRESFSDQRARNVAMDALKSMIRSWLDDTYPTMPEAERKRMAEAMDISLLEKKKEESMKTFYEINNVVRMSFIEMQYMKKEMMNALHAMDEVMSSNDINMNLAAITPVALLGYVSHRVFRFFYYAFLQLGQSREQTYAAIRNIVTDIERLLVMRNDPPLPRGREAGGGWPPRQPSVINSDDLGMLMLLIHEIRSILIRDRRRFSADIIRSVWEDLAELAGERGAVSIQQQLSIINRMCRTYPFLKVVSTGHLFEFNPHWRP